MNRESFERVIRSCCRHLGRDEVIVIGSQALFASQDQLPEVAMVSGEVDIVLVDEDDREDVAGLFGELSRFHETWGVYADPVDVTTGRFPAGWQGRLVEVLIDDPRRGRRYVARCAEPHDLCVAKLVADRPKDHAFIAALLKEGTVARATIAARLANTELTEDERAAARDRLDGWAAHA